MVAPEESVREDEESLVTANLLIVEQGKLATGGLMKTHASHEDIPIW